MRFAFLFLFFFCSICYASTIIPPVLVKPPSQTVTHGDKSTITHEDIQISGANSLAQVLQELGGIQLQDSVGNSSQVALSMRGFGSNASSNTLLLINGIPITNPDLMAPNLNIIPLHEIESIEITAGSESVLYGDQAVGGIININTKHFIKPKLEFTCLGGSYNQRNCYVDYQNFHNNLKYSINAYSNYTNNYRQQNKYHQNSVSGTLDYSHASGNLGFIYHIANEYMQYPGALTAAQVFQNRRQANNDTNYFRNWNGSYHLQDKQQLNSNWRLEMDLVRREMHGNGILFTDFNQSRTIHFFKPQIIGTIGKALTTSGFDIENDNYYLRSVYGVNSDNQQKYGLFTVLNYPLTSRWSLSVGARGAQQNNALQQLTQDTSAVNRAFASTIGAAFQMNAATKFYLRRAENFRFPKADEEASAPPTGLKTQRGVSYETGVLVNWKNSVSKFNLYQLNLRDEIMFDPMQTPQDPFGTNRNLSPTVRQGFSLSEKIPVTQKITLDGQYNYVNARFQNGVNVGN